MSYLGEVVESSTRQVLAQARELHGMPPYGSLVRVVETDLTHYGIVNYAYTGSADPARRPMALGLTQEELRREQPQIFALLRSEFSFVVIGYREGREPEPYRGFYPPRPPRLHSFVTAGSHEEEASVGADLVYIRRLLGETGAEELVAAAIRCFRGASPDPAAYTVRAGRELLRALGEDAARFRAVMDRLG